MHTTKLSRLGLSLILPAAITLAQTLPADANVRKTKHGSTACETGGYYVTLPPALLAPGEHWARVAHDQLDGIYMLSNTPETVSAITKCSIDRDLPLSEAGLSDLEFRFVAVDTTEPKSVMCFVNSFRKDGTILDQEIRSVLVPSSDQQAKHTLLEFGNSIGATGSKGTIVATCIVPSNVGLTSIYSSEVDGISGN